MEEVKLPYATLYYNEPIVYTVFNENVELGFPEVRALIFHSEKLSGYKPYVAFSDARAENIRVTPQGRKAAAAPGHAPLSRGSALLVNSNVLKTALNLFDDIGGFHGAFKAFTDRQEAIDWLLKLPLYS